MLVIGPVSFPSQAKVIWINNYTYIPMARNELMTRGNKVIPARLTNDKIQNLIIADPDYQ